MAAAGEPLTLELVWCADGNLAHSRDAVAAGWLYGCRLPARGMLDAPLFFADQDWKRPDRARYMALLARHRPNLATVLDWERPDQYAEVMSWAEEAAAHVREAVLVIPKVVGGVADVPASVGGVEVRIAYSVPTSYGGSPVPLWELRGRRVHLLGGSPHAQAGIWRYLAREVVSVDGNMIKKQATSRCLYWTAETTRKGHWQALEGFDGSGHEECVRRSCRNAAGWWRQRLTLRRIADHARQQEG